MAKVNRQISLRSLFIFTALVALSLSFTLVNHDGPKTIGCFALASLIGGAIGFAVTGRNGFVYGAIFGFMAFVPLSALLLTLMWSS